MDIHLWEGRKFYDYYQIAEEDDDDESEEFGSGLKGESKSRMEGSHSLFGIIWSLQKETGWSNKYVLWGESWFNLQLKLSDAPRMVRGGRAKRIEDADDLEAFLKS